jgi:hypothetical protein
MPELTISTELVRCLRHQAPKEVTDYRDPKLPGFVLRARPSGIHSWRVQLPNRRWLTLGRVDEVALSDARETAQTRRAQAALGQDIPTRKPKSEVTLRTFLDDTYEPWMKATYGKRTTQVALIRSAFRELLDLNLSEFTTARVERWRVNRKFHHAASDAPAKRKSREVKRSTINRNIKALRAALNRATEWGVLSAMPLGKIKFRAEDENAVVRYLSDDEEARLRAALVARDSARRTARASANEWRRARGYPALLEPLLFYVLHRVNDRLAASAASGQLTLCVMDEAWRFIQHDRLRAYVQEALKTWRKRNASMLLATQAIDDFASADLLRTVVESCPTKLLLANPSLNRSQYAELFQLNEMELDLLTDLIPRRQLLLKRAHLAKVLNLNVDPRSYWLYTNTPIDNERVTAVFREHGFEAGLDQLAASA